MNEFADRRGPTNPPSGVPRERPMPPPRLDPSTILRNCRFVVAVGALMGSIAPGCGRRDTLPTSDTPPAEVGQAAPHPDAEGNRRLHLEGQIVRVDRASGSVAIRHESIPGYMPAMTMPFDLDGQEILEELQVGDEVEGTLIVGTESSELADLVITRPATAPSSDSVEGGSEAPRPGIERLSVGQEVPDFSVTTQDGERLSLADLRGRVVALTFIYTRCPLPNFCPRMDQNFRRLADLVEMLPRGAEERVRLVSVSFDPEHDTPEVLARHAATLGARPPLWTFVVAEHEELRKVAEPLGLHYGPTPNEIIHNLVTAVIGPDGRLLRLDSGGELDPRDLYGTIARAATGRFEGEAPDAPSFRD